ncbi:MAG: discoidin domain-containing protein, partial [Pseudomonadota bacterium]
HVFALQPMFRNCKKERTPIEQEIEKITGMEKIGFYDARMTYNELANQIKAKAKEINFEVVDLSTVFDNTHEWVFTDWCHLTNGANYVIAKALVNEVKQRIFGLSLNPSDKMVEPPDSYFADYSKEAKLLVSGKPRDDGQNILKGYPSDRGLKIDPVPESGMVIDLGKVVPLSRLRIVWGSEQSVPRSWKLEVSEDGDSWKEWLKVDETKTDPYDQWPGYEYYAGVETPARFIKYSQEATGNEIYLRQLSLFR